MGNGSSNLLTSPAPKLMQHSSSFGLLAGVDAFSLFPHNLQVQSQQQQSQAQRNSGGGASSPSTLLQRMSHQPRLQVSHVVLVCITIDVARGEL